MQKKPERDPDPLDRLRPEAGENVQRQTGQPERRIAGAPRPRRMSDVDLDHARPAGKDQRLRELLLADRGQHRLDRAAAIRVEGAAEVGDVGAGEAAKHAVDEARGERSPPGVPTDDAASAGHVRTALDCRDEQRDVLRRVLQVAVHGDEDFAPGANQPGVHRRVLAEVAFEAHRADPSVRRVDPLQLGEGRVERAVVDANQLEIEIGWIQRLDGSTVELGHVGGLVVERQDDRNRRNRLIGRVGQSPWKNLPFGGAHEAKA